MRVGEPVRILAAAAALGLALAGLVTREGLERAAGHEVALRMEVVERLTGEDLELRLRDVQPGGARCPPGTEHDTGLFLGQDPRGWVALEQNEGQSGWRVAGAAASREQAGRFGHVLVRGFAACAAGGVELDLGLDRFHGDRGEAARIERLLRAGRPGEAHAVQALVSVGRDGRARLVAVSVDGRRVELDWL